MPLLSSPTRPHPGLALWQLALVLMCSSLLAGCAASQVREPSPTPTASAQPTAIPSATPIPSVTPIPSPTPVQTPPALPPAFSTDILNPKDVPQTYVADTCQYLHDRWASGNSPPGTVAMVIMFHSITEGQIKYENQISRETFEALMEGLHESGFEAINTIQLADFLEHNALIPPRSVVLLADDRHGRSYFDDFFGKYHEQYGWPVVNAWISAEGTADYLWAENDGLEREGWVDHQAHGVVHNIPIWPGSSDGYILGELQGSIDAFEDHYGKRPIAIIWPGGGFTPRAAELARQTGYRLGFTINPRGPVMFNWIPLGSKQDPMRPSYQPEAGVNDPLMVLPRYWDIDALKYVPDVVAIAQDAAADATTWRDTELEYYDIVCAADYGPLAKP